MRSNEGVTQARDAGRTPGYRQVAQDGRDTRQIVRAKYQHLAGEELLSATIEENVLSQIENLQTHPAVAVGLMRGVLKLHAWHYEIETGEIYATTSNRGNLVR